MKKTNFLVVFWLVISLISFIVFLFSLSGLFDTVSYILFPTDDETVGLTNLYRILVQNVPILIVSVVCFILGLRQGLKEYRLD